MSKKRQALFSLSLHPSESSIVVGAVAKVLWIDLDTQSTLRTFSGHQGDVITLRVFSPANTTFTFAVSGGAGDKDRVLSVWKLDSDDENKDAQPAAMLNVNDTVGSLCLAEEPEDSSWLVGAVTKSGVHCFQFEPEVSGGRKKGRPVRPKVTVQVKSLSEYDVMNVSFYLNNSQF